MRNVLGIFAKEPGAGKVKTRLCPPLTPTQASRLYQVFLQETVSAMRAGRFDLVLFYSGDESFFRTAVPDLPRVPQGEGSLGVRMCRALNRLLEGGGTAGLIGTDSPDLPLALVERAFFALRRADFVTIPSADGGYVLVGERRHRPEMFRDIPWSSGAVLGATRRRAAERGFSYIEVGRWEDVDDLPSLERFLARSPHSATARLAARMLEDPDLKEPALHLPFG